MTVVLLESSSTLLRASANVSSQTQGNVLYSLIMILTIFELSESVVIRQRIAVGGLSLTIFHFKDRNHYPSSFQHADVTTRDRYQRVATTPVASVYVKRTTLVTSVHSVR